LDASSNQERCFGGMENQEKKVKEGLGPWSLEVDAFSYSVEYLKGEK